MSPAGIRQMSPLGNALIEEVQNSNAATREELRSLRGELGRFHRHLFAVLFALVVTNLFLAALLAASKGVDPRDSADAVRSVLPVAGAKASP